MNADKNTKEPNDSKLVELKSGISDGALKKKDKLEKDSKKKFA